MMEVYHGSVTAAVTPDRPLRLFEYVVIPPIRLVLDTILTHCEVGERIAPGIRQLGEWSGVTLGLITDCLRQLDSRGIITYDGRVIMLLRDPDTADETDRSADRSVCEETDESDRSPDRSLSLTFRDRLLKRRNGHAESDRSADRSDFSPPHPPYGNHDLAAAAAAHESLPRGGMQGGGEPDRSPDRSPASLFLVELGCDDSALRGEILASHPDLTPAQLSAQWALALERERAGYTDNARRLLFGTLRKSGGWLYGRARAQAWPEAVNDSTRLDDLVQADDPHHSRTVPHSTRPDPADAAEDCAPADDARAFSAAYHHARALAPPGLAHAMLTELIYAILGGASDEQVLDLLAQLQAGGGP
jgi:hypothetical protein